MHSRKPFLAAAAMGLGLLTGCVSHQVDDHSFQFNQATGSLNMRLLLLNAVRASKDYPLQFSKLATYKGKGFMGRAELNASLPLRQTIEGTLSPKFEFNDGINQFDLVDLNTEEAQEALKRPLSHSGFDYLTKLTGNRSSILPQLLLVEQVDVSKELARNIDESVKCTCNIADGKGKECDSSIVDARPSPPLEDFEKSQRNDLKLRALIDTFKRDPNLRLIPFRQLTKENLFALRLKWSRRPPPPASAEEKEKRKDEVEIFERYVKSAANYLELGARLERLKDDRSKFITDLQGNSSVAQQIKHACASLKTIENECPGERYPVTMNKRIVLKNTLRTECGHKLFIYGLLQSHVIGMRAAKEPDKPDEGGKPDSTRPLAESGNTFKIYAVDPKEDKAKEDKGKADKGDRLNATVLNPIFAASCLSKRLCTIGGTTPTGIKGDEISFQLRSPERVVRYLGELIAAQNYGEQPFKPSLFDPELKGPRFAVLTVLRGIPLPGTAAVSIRDPEGVTFYIPRRSHDSAKDDLSLETLSIVTDVLNAAVSKKNFPSVATITVANP